MSVVFNFNKLKVFCKTDSKNAFFLHKKDDNLAYLLLSSLFILFVFS